MKPILQATFAALLVLAVLAGVVYGLAWYGGRPIVNTPTGHQSIERIHHEALSR